MDATLTEGGETTLVCYVNVSAAVDTPINVTTSWSGPNGPITSGSDYTLSPAIQTVNGDSAYEGRLVISKLLLSRDNGATYTCTVTLSSTTDPVHLLSNNGSDGYIVIINGNIQYS